MPISSSNVLREAVLCRLKNELGESILVKNRPIIRVYNGFKTNVRVATKKSGDKYWFDVTPALYEKKLVDYFIYACGSSDSIFVFPVNDLAELIESASIGGSKQVPNFTIYLDTSDFEPAGRADDKHKIQSYLNNFNLLKPQSKHDN